MNKENIIRFLSQTNEDRNAQLLYEKIGQLLASYVLAEKVRFIHKDKWIFSSFGRLNLEAHSRVCRLFLYFIEKDKQEVTKEELLLAIYKEEMFPRPSDRRLDCLERNLVKVISRARQLAKSSFRESPKNVSWFPYHPAKKTWSLFVLIEEIADAG